MHGLFVALGDAAREVDAGATLPVWPGADGARRELLEPADGVRLLRLAPADAPDEPVFACSDDGRVAVAMVGYLLPPDGGPSAQPALLARFANRCRAVGAIPALREDPGGSWAAAITDRERGTTTIVGDRFATIPLYYARLPNGLVVSTNPVALARLPAVDRRPDLTAMAELVYIGHTIGDRHFLNGIRQLMLEQALVWDAGAQRIRIEPRGRSPFARLPEPRRDAADELAEAARSACRRLARVDRTPAHLQSAGWDSRLILAAWPGDTNPPCFTYGDPGAHEPGIAREVARVRGSTFTHAFATGDEVADRLDEIFDTAGLLVYPDRLHIAELIRGRGHRGLLDGFLGDALLGGGFYNGDRYFSPVSRAGRWVLRFVDQRVSRIGLAAVSDAVLDNISEVRRDELLGPWLDADFVAALRSRLAAVREELHAELARLAGVSDSLALLWRNFKITNRSAHSIVQQAVLGRRHLRVYNVFTSDPALVDLMLSLEPRATAYHRLYRELFVRHFPAFADVRWGRTLLPLRSPLARHKLSAAAVSRGWVVPGVTPHRRGRELDPNGWAHWLRTSGRVRAAAADALRRGGVLSARRGAGSFRELAAGTRRGHGKIFHLASVGRWLALGDGSD